MEVPLERPPHLSRPSARNGRLSAEQRSRDLASMEGTVLDVLVVGGGVVGAGAALDAASRGLLVGIVEQRDWAAGSSSRSSRLAHGGLRYLEHLEFGLVREALTERGLLLDVIAPHLVKPVPFILPIRRRREQAYLGAGVLLYDILARCARPRRGRLPRHRHLSHRATVQLAPGLDPAAFSSSLKFYDAQVDDASHTLAVVRTAKTFGALAASRTEVVGIDGSGDGDAQGSVRVVRAVDHESNRDVVLRARVVIGATGAWTTSTDGLLGPDLDREATDGMAPSKGVHLVIRGSAIDLQAALIARTSRSVLFVLPWGPTWLVGTTDTPWTGSLDDPPVDSADVDYLLGEVNRWLSRPIGHVDVVSSYAGIRPLALTGRRTPGRRDLKKAGAREVDTTAVSREHVVRRTQPGLVQVFGGKYTTYRVMAADAVDAALVDLGSEAGVSRTADIPVVGARGFRGLWSAREVLAEQLGLDLAQVERLLRRYGDEILSVLAPAISGPELLEPLVPGSPVIGAEAVYAATHEGALTVADVLDRRTRLALAAPADVGAAAPRVAALLGDVLGWDSARIAEAAEEYTAGRTFPVSPAHSTTPLEHTS